jgi:hypothetical protein
MKEEQLSNHVAALGRHGAKKRWKDTSEDERSKVMELVRNGKTKRAREAKRPQNPAFAWMKARMVRDNQVSRRIQKKAVPMLWAIARNRLKSRGLALLSSSRGLIEEYKNPPRYLL